MKVYFFVGKGGVGKTTSAAAFSMLLASRGLRTLIVSLDPAHNLGDVFGIPLGEKPKQIVENLWGIEVDFDRAVQQHLKNLCDRIKDAYAYLRVLNLDRYIDTLRHAPGVEEYAALEKVVEFIKRSKDIDALVFDTPPTGLTVRMLALPFVNEVWLEKLLELRRAILERRKAIAKILKQELVAEIGGEKVKLPTEEEEDPVSKELRKMLNETREVINVLRNPSVTSIGLILNPETLPVLEAKRALETFRKLGLPTKFVIVNKVLRLSGSTPPELEARLEEQRKALEMIENEFRGLRIVYVPLLAREPRGIDALKEYAKHIEDLLEV